MVRLLVEWPYYRGDLFREVKMNGQVAIGT